MPRHALAAFSRWRAEIEAAMAAAGAFGPEAARIATFATRRAKDYRVRPEQLVDEWRERAAHLGLGRLHLTRLLGRMQPIRLDSDKWTQLFDELAGPTGLTAKESTFTRPDVLRAIAERLLQGAPVRTIEEAADRFLRSSRAVRLLVPRDALRHPVAIRRQDGRRLALARQALSSTPELLELERQIVDRARDVATRWARNGAPGRSGWRPREPALALSRADRDGAAPHDRRRRPGGGRREGGHRQHDGHGGRAGGVVGTRCRGHRRAVARRAAHELERGAGIPSTSLTALLHRGIQAIPHDGVVVFDEAAWWERGVSRSS
jgi:hypothetical protein